jgi:hypothetical protein
LKKFLAKIGEILENAFAFSSCGVDSTMQTQRPAGKASQARPRRSLATEEARGLPAESESIFAFINNKVYEKSL